MRRDVCIWVCVWTGPVVYGLFGAVLDPDFLLTAPAASPAKQPGGIGESNLPAMSAKGSFSIFLFKTNTFFTHDDIIYICLDLMLTRASMWLYVGVYMYAATFEAVMGMYTYLSKKDMSVWQTGHTAPT